MKKKFFDAKNIAVLALLLALMMVLNMTSIGFLQLGPIAVTTMHIPVLLGGLIGGWKYGTILGLAFGLSSLFKALQGLTPTAFIFVNPLVSVLPRIIFGFLCGLLADMFRGKNQFMAFSLPALIGSLTNTVLVMGTIYVLYAKDYMRVLGLSEDLALATVLGVCVSNGIPEAIVAMIICTVICVAIKYRNKGRKE